VAIVADEQAAHRCKLKGINAPPCAADKDRTIPFFRTGQAPYMSEASDPADLSALGSNARLARRSAWLIVSLMLCLFLGAMGALSHVSATLDADEAVRSELLAKKAMDAWIKALSSSLLDYAFWDEAYEHTHGVVDTAWTERKVAIGRSLLSEYGLNSVFIVDARMETRYAYVGGEFNTRHAAQWIEGDLTSLLAEAQAKVGQRVAVKGFFTVEGRPALVAAAAITPTSYPLKTPADRLAYFVFVDALGPESLTRMADTYGLPGLRLSSADAADTRVSFQLSAQPPIYLTWDVATPGVTFLKMIFPALLLGALIFSGGAWVLLRRFIRAAGEVDHSRGAQAQIAYLSRHDSLTGLPNRVHAYEVLEQRFTGTSTNAAFSILFLDLSGFKQINNYLGHIAADQILITVARRLKLALGERNFLARLGGDEFLIITPEVSTKGVGKVCQSLLETFDSPIVTTDHELRLGLCIGIAQTPVDTTDAQELLRLADIALSEAKSRGKHCWQLYDSEMKIRVEERRGLEQDLKRAVQRNEFSIVLQPRFEITGQRIVGAEALVRWVHPEKGLLSPGVFIPLAEETGLIVGISDIVLQSACSQIASWDEAIFVSVNLSCIEFMRGDLIARVQEALRASGLPPSRLEIEVTESVMIDNAKGALKLMRELKALGVKLSMDDFGTGYSSLSYLSTYPFDGIKIDRSFVMNLGDPKANNQAIVNAVVAMGKSMGMVVTAEGVETAEQLRVLQSLGCDQAQGFYLGRPMAPEALDKLLCLQNATAGVVTSELPVIRPRPQTAV
jgi:diguanylate cyclase (GGDEF)-like protein